MMASKINMDTSRKPTGQTQDKPQTGRGGARPNTGPKPLEPKIRRSVGLSERQWTIFDAQGGNDWLRDVLDAVPPAKNIQK